MLRYIIIGVLLSIVALPIEARHLSWRHPTHHKNTGSNVIGVLIFFSFLFSGIAYLVYRCRRSRNTLMPPPPPPLPLPPQPPVYRPNLYQSLHLGQLIPIKDFKTITFLSLTIVTIILNLRESKMI